MDSFFLDTIIEEQKYTINKVNSQEIKKFALTMGFVLQNLPTLSYTASFEGLPLGLLTFKEKLNENELHLEQFYIGHAFINKGLEEHLFETWESEYPSSLWVPLNKFKATIYKKITSILTRKKYQLSSQKAALYWGEKLTAELYKPISLKKRTVKPPFYFVDFPLLKSEDVQQMKKIYNSDPECHDSFLPSYYQQSIDPITSVVLKKNEEVIGWVLNHRTKNDHVHYSGYYASPKYRRSIVAAKLLYCSIYRHLYHSLEIPGRSGKTILPLNQNLSYFKKMRYHFPHHLEKELWEKI
jgi:hypothetical protein